MEDEKHKHFIRLPVKGFPEQAEADPKVLCTAVEVETVLKDLTSAVDTNSYFPATPTVENPALSDDYIFDTEDEKQILKDLEQEHFVGKVMDLGKGAVRRRKQGLPQEYLYIFQYPCRLYRRDAQESKILTEDILIYIKINNRKNPDKQVFIISFHKNRPRKKTK